ncbi:T9SS sorting signal type C domain-containing protein [Flavobacterium gyeonganense]|uniref:T9SS sorting signal type C domain-containing protein n=1 Tax=Flavobacterium gyeonganense TaxID=1310418 RepID=A0ABV5HFA8_9FLAO|nr:T9SS sorting signal type C domain-containing protein [Flavobacterium gyeonganense]
MRLKLLFLLFFVYSIIWAQPPHTYTTPGNGAFKIPAGVTTLNVECWGAGGAGGGVYNLVSLFGGGGGGGGAYSKVSTFAVTPAASLSYKVGAGGAGVNGADGQDGESTNFSTVTANGGSGGKHGNTANGAGGARALASTGTGTYYSGGAGALARTILVTVLSSGGGGGSAGTAANGNNASTNLLDANGGAAVTGGGAGASGMTLVGGGNGNNGSSPGGGGGGALGLLNSNFRGGNGGNGQIKINYTCPTYGFTAPTTADNVCTSIATTSLVRLTGLPNGDYVVTYNRSNPGQNGLTATMSVTGGTGIGTFTAVGLTTPGSSTITITNLTSESCTNSVNTNNAVTINVYSASVGGTINTPPAICSGGTSGSLTLSGYTGTITGWEYSVDPFSSWTPISNITDALSPGILTQTTQFRALVKNGTCNQTTSAVTTVTVNPLPTIATTGTLDNICFSASSQTATLPYTATTNTPVSYSIVWSAAANTAGLVNQGTTAFSFSSGGGNLSTIAIPAGVTAGAYTGTMTIQNANCSSTQAIQLTINATSVGGTISTPAAICSGGTSGQLNLSGHTGTILGWEYSVAPFSSWIPISNTTTSHSPGVLTQTTQFRALVKNGTCNQTTSAVTTVTVNPLPTITTTGTVNPICFSTGSQTATLPYTATTNTPVSYSIVWSAAANTAGLVNQGTTAFSFSSGGGNLSTIAIPANVAANTYTGTMTIQSANCSSTQAIQLTIVPKPSAPIPGTITEPTCITPTGSLTLSGLPSSVTWLIKQTGPASTTYTGTGTSYPISNLLPGNYQFTVEYTGSCISDASTTAVVNSLVTNTYNSSWSNGTPTINQNLVFASNYSSAGGGLGNISGCSCLVNSGVTVVMNSNDTLTIQNAVVNSGGTLTFENNASLLQNNAVAVNSGNIIYKRISTPMKNFDFTYWSSPVAGQTLFELSPNTLWDKYLSYTGTGWHQEQYGASVMAKGIGYIIRTPKAGSWPNGEVVTFPYSQAVAFIGTPNNGNITGQSVNAGKFYLIGNPYPSAISADAFLFDNPNNSAILGGTVYFWTHNTPLKMIGPQQAYSSSDYATYNGVGGTLTAPAPSGGALPSGKIAAGQSFFALATANGTVMFNNGMRIQGNNNQFFKPPKTSKSSSLEKHRLWLNMTNEGGAFKQLLIGYIEGASNGYDNDFDGITFDGNAYIDFYSINENSKLTIQGRALPFNNTDIVNLGYRTVISGKFKISVNNADGMLSSHPVYLEDKLTHTITDLTQNDYVFNSSVGVFNNRFVLRYANATLSTDEFEHENNVLAWLDKKTLRINSTEKTINKVFVYDITGKLVYSDFEILASEVAISTLKFKNEILLLKIVLADNHIITKKIITFSE